MPTHPKPDAPAIRVLVRAVKSSRAPLSLLPGFVLADQAGKPTPQAEAVLRGITALPLSNL
jgi:tRNA1(Val) A37 N6-methylase TrmN6